MGNRNIDTCHGILKTDRTTKLISLRLTEVAFIARDVLKVSGLQDKTGYYLQVTFKLQRNYIF
jgi:hypothetical protein